MLNFWYAVSHSVVLFCVLGQSVARQIKFSQEVQIEIGIQFLTALDCDKS